MEAKVWIPKAINSSTELRIAGLLLSEYNVVYLIAEEIVRKDVRIAEFEKERNLLFEGIANLSQRLEKEETLRREKNVRIAELEAELATANAKRYDELNGTAKGTAVKQ